MAKTGIQNGNWQKPKRVIIDRRCAPMIKEHDHSMKQFRIEKQPTVRYFT